MQKIRAFLGGKGRPVAVVLSLLPAVFAAVRKLDIGVRAGVVDGPRDLRHALLDAERIQLELFVVRFAGRRMYDCFAVGNDRRAAFGLFLKIGRHFRCKMPFSRDHARAGRRRDDAVLQANIADPDR